jgi:hypothetical protein
MPRFNPPNIGIFLISKVLEGPQAIADLDFLQALMKAIRQFKSSWRLFKSLRYSFKVNWIRKYPGPPAKEGRFTKHLRHVNLPYACPS